MMDPAQEELGAETASRRRRRRKAEPSTSQGTNSPPSSSVQQMEAGTSDATASEQQKRRGRRRQGATDSLLSSNKDDMPRESKDQPRTLQEDPSNRQRGSAGEKRSEDNEENIRNSRRGRRGKRTLQPREDDIDEEEENAVDGLTQTNFEDHIMSVTIHRVDELYPDNHIKHPVVRVHFLDSNTGQPLPKRDPSRQVVANYERVSHILSVISQPFYCTAETGLTAAWNEDILLDEQYLWFLQDHVVAIFEVLDFGVRTKDNEPYYRIAWGFLKLVGPGGHVNTESTVRLQLYKYKTAGGPWCRGRDREAPHPDTPLAYYNYLTKKKVPYPSTLYVTLSGKIRPSVMDRTEAEVTEPQDTYPEDDSGSWSDNSDSSEEENVSQNAIRRRRAEGHACVVPESLLHRLDVGPKGCSTLRFSTSGRYLAAACSDGMMYSFKKFSVATGKSRGHFIGHHDIIYDISWAKNDSTILTASKDCTVKVWDSEEPEQGAVKVLHHTCYVYAAEYHPAFFRKIVFTGAYDHIIRVWDVEREEQLADLHGHESHVSSICFTKNGDRMFSGDGHGVIKVWATARVSDDTDQKSTSFKYSCVKTITHGELLNETINCVRISSNDRRLMVHARDNMIRTIETRTWKISQRYSGLHSKMHPIRGVFSPDDKYIISGSEDGKLYLWTTQDGKLINRGLDVGLTVPICDVVWHPTEHVIAVCGFGGYQPVLVFQHLKSMADVKRELQEARQKQEAEARKAKNHVENEASKLLHIRDRLSEKDKIKLDILKHLRLPTGHNVIKQFQEKLQTMGKDAPKFHLPPSGDRMSAAAAAAAAAPPPRPKRKHTRRPSVLELPEAALGGPPSTAENTPRGNMDKTGATKQQQLLKEPTTPTGLKSPLLGMKKSLGNIGRRLSFSRKKLDKGADDDDKATHSSPSSPRGPRTPR